MKFFPHSLLLPLLLCITIGTCGQCPDWEKLLGYSKVYPQNLVRDYAGNIFVSATYFGPVEIEGHTFNETDFLQSGLLLKYDKHFKLLWIREMGGALASDIEIDLKGNIILSGAFYGSHQDFGCFSFSGQPDYAEAFIMKLTNDGIPVWGVQAVGPLVESFNDLKVTTENNLVAIGGHDGSNFTFGSLPVEGFGETDGFVVSLTEDGEVTWALGMGGSTGGNSTGGNPIDQVTDLALDHNGNIIICGQYGSYPFRLGNVTLPGGATAHWFIAKLTSSGAVSWTKSHPEMAGDSWSVTTDANNDIYFSGAFEDIVTFGTHTLSTFGLTDIFVVKYNPAGEVLGAMNIGGAGYDNCQELQIDMSNNLVAGGFSQSETFQFGTFFSTGTTETTDSDVFIGVLDKNLNALCLETTSGDAFKNLWSLEIDSSNNLSAIIEAHSGTTNYGGKFTHTDAQSEVSLVFLGANDLYHGNPINEFDIDLGPDRQICPGEDITLYASESCGFTLRWSNGTSGTSLQVTQPGVYWLEATSGSVAIRDSMEVTLRAKVLATNLGADRLLCNGEVATMNVTNPDATDYLWSDGSTNPVKILSQPGSYWAKISNECFQAQDDIVLTTLAPLPEFDLGEDRLMCPGTEFIAPAVQGAELNWSDGSRGQSLIVNKSGTYVASIQNACEIKRDSVDITLMTIENLMIPNVVTADQNGKNDTFILPDILTGSELQIYNRWGADVYHSENYQNDWSGEGLASGTYFYFLTATCLGEPAKGTVSLLHPE